MTSGGRLFAFSLSSGHVSRVSCAGIISMPLHRHPQPSPAITQQRPHAHTHIHRWVTLPCAHACACASIPHPRTRGNSQGMCRRCVQNMRMALHAAILRKTDTDPEHRSLYVMKLLALSERIAPKTSSPLRPLVNECSYGRQPLIAAFAAPGCGAFRPKSSRRTGTRRTTYSYSANDAASVSPAMSSSSTNHGMGSARR